MCLVLRANTVPRKGDVFVTIQCDAQTLEDRMALMAYAFSRAVQGGILRQVTKWDLKNGCIECIVDRGETTDVPEGEYSVRLREWDKAK